MQLELSVFLPIVTLFLCGVAYTTYLGLRQTKSFSDYLVAGRSVNGFVAGLSYGAALISTSAIIGFSGVAAHMGLSIYWGIFGNMVISCLLAFTIFGIRTRAFGIKLDAVTFADMMSKRYESRFMKVFIGAIIYLFIPMYTSVVLIGGARFLEGCLGINFYTALIFLSAIVCLYVLFGGLMGLMYTDALLAGVMIFGALFLVFNIYYILGGVAPAHQALTNMATMVPESLRNLGHTGWTSMPSTGSPIWWNVMSTIVLGMMAGTLAQPHLAIKFMAIKRKSQLYLGLAVASIFVLFLTGGTEIVGALSNVYFYRETGQLAVEVAQGNLDLVMPSYITSAMPNWFVYLFMLGLLAATMSTSAALLHLQGTCLANDIYGGITGKEIKDKKVAQVGTVLGLVLALVLGFFLPGSIIARATVFWFGLCALSWLPALIGCLFWKRATKAGAIASMLTGFTFTMFWYVFIKTTEAAPLGIARALTGQDTLLGHPWSNMDPLVIGLPLSVLVFITVSLSTKKPSDTIIQKLFR